MHEHLEKQGMMVDNERDHRTETLDGPVLCLSSWDCASTRRGVDWKLTHEWRSRSPRLVSL